MLEKGLSSVSPSQVWGKKDYQRIATLKETFSSIVSKAAVKRSKDGFQCVLPLANAGFLFERGPCILFNLSKDLGF